VAVAEEAHGARSARVAERETHARGPAIGARGAFARGLAGGAGLPDRDDVRARPARGMATVGLRRLHATAALALQVEPCVAGGTPRKRADVQQLASAGAIRPVGSSARLQRGDRRRRPGQARLVLAELPEARAVPSRQGARNRGAPNQRAEEVITGGCDPAVSRRRGPVARARLELRLRSGVRSLSLRALARSAAGDHALRDENRRKHGTSPHAGSVSRPGPLARSIGTVTNRDVVCQNELAGTSASARASAVARHGDPFPLPRGRGTAGARPRACPTPRPQLVSCSCSFRSRVSSAVGAPGPPRTGAHRPA
jgi:hypothetical protein